MSVVFVVGSEEQLSCGATWCERLAAVNHLPVYIAVVGTDRKALAESARRKVSAWRAGEKPNLELVESDTRAVLEHASSVGCKTLLIVHRTSDEAFQRKLFEESMVRTIWVHAKDVQNASPPDSPTHVYAMFRRPSLVTRIAAEQILGITPATTLCENVNLNEDDLPSAVKSAMEAKAVGAGDLVLCGVEDATSSDRIFKAGLVLLQQTDGATIALVRTGHSLAETMALKVHQWAASVAPPMERAHRIELAQDLQTGSRPNLEFLGLMSASAMLAAFGLLQDSAAVIIGAMLIAPLMTPILGAGLALSQGNRPLFQSAFWTITIGFIGALSASMAFGWLFWLFQEPHITGEMWARCRPSPLDFCVGLVGGIAASYARTRHHLSSALAGAAIAAALVPPIATAGLQIAFGEWDESKNGVPVVGPLLLVSINVLTIMIGSSFVLWARGMRSDRALGLTAKWGLRMFALLLALVLLTLIWILHPFPDS
jgi:uncharacterized hydrophobic protein (TIGR00271 family)